MADRPWTRLGIVSIVGHLGYELVAGVAVPLAPHVGVRSGVAAFAVPAVVAWSPAGRWDGPRADRTYAVVNGLFLAAVLAHYSSWPRVWRAGVPWLTECEGLQGPVMVPYNLLLQVSAVAAVAGLRENGSQWRWGIATTAVVTPLLRWATPREFARLLEQAAERPRWWNRRLARRTSAPPRL